MLLLPMRKLVTFAILIMILGYCKKQPAATGATTSANTQAPPNTNTKYITTNKMNDTAAVFKQLDGKDPVDLLYAGQQVVLTEGASRPVNYGGLPGKLVPIETICAPDTACRPARGWIFDGYLTTTKVEKKFVTAKGGLNVRATPDRNGERVGLIPFGTELLTFERKGEKITVDGLSGSWVRVSDDVVKGWAFDGFLSDKKPQSDEEINASKAAREKYEADTVAYKACVAKCADDNKNASDYDRRFLEGGCISGCAEKYPR